MSEKAELSADQTQLLMSALRLGMYSVLTLSKRDLLPPHLAKECETELRLAAAAIDGMTLEKRSEGDEEPPSVQLLLAIAKNIGDRGRRSNPESAA